MVDKEITLRRLNYQDVTALDSLYADRQLMQAAGLVIDANPEFRRMVFSNWIAHGYIWGIFHQQKLIGTINLFPQDNSLEIGYLLLSNYRRQGIMTKAVKQLLAQVAGRPILAKVRANNLASQRVLKNVGFQLIAQNQEWMRFLKNK